MRVWSSLAVPFVAVMLALPVHLSAQQPRTGDAARLRPLAGFSCDPNRLTSYTGVVSSYVRRPDSTTLRIKTDWGTTEEVTVKHPDTEDPSRYFRYAGQPFTSADWARVERARGVLIEGTRATAWVCADGQVMVDWGVPSEVR